MPPRVGALQFLGTVKFCLRPRVAAPRLAPLVQTAGLSAKLKRRKAKQDPYQWAQAQQRKNANLQRRGELEAQRAEALGDPVVGNLTPFVESLDAAGQCALSEVPRDGSGNLLAEPRELPTAPGMRNFFLSDAELQEVVRDAFLLTQDKPSLVAARVDPSMEPDKAVEAHARRHRTAVTALQRITSLDNGSARDRFHANVKRIVDEFGRHKTDQFLKPRLPSICSHQQVPMPGRCGPDTGSSEVQIAILTAKIRALSQALQTNRGYKDKLNQKNLRLLVHRRQKLLRYMDKKERGSERWTHMVGKLGIVPAMWKGEISM